VTCHGVLYIPDSASVESDFVTGEFGFYRVRALKYSVSRKRGCGIRMKELL
jgi:hypothetical protein